MRKGSTQNKMLFDAKGAPYVPAVAPPLKKLLVVIFGAVAILGATGVYLAAITIAGFHSRGRTDLSNRFLLLGFHSSSRSDDNARGTAIRLHRSTHEAADHAAQSIVIYNLNGN